MKTYTTETIKVNGLAIKAHKVPNDSNGNPRWVVHFLDLLTKDEQDKIYKEATEREDLTFSTELMYEKALTKARKVGGKRYRAKWYGGGIVFQSYNIKQDLEQVTA